MSIDIKVPAMGESVTEATVARWFKKEGESVARDEPLLELETDKVTVEVPAPAAGSIESISVKAGATVAVGAVLGSIAEGKPGKATAVPAANPDAAKPAQAKSEAPKPQPAAPKPEAPKPAPKADAQVMPSAQRISAESGIPTAAVAGTGRDGRVTKGDMLEALEARAARPAQPVSAPSGPRSHADREEKVPMSRLRKTIALRLKESQNTAAQLTTFNEADMSRIMALRSEYKDSFEKKHGVRLGFMGFFAKACVAALKELPNVNAELEGDNIVYKNYYDIGVAVSTERGLVVPVVRDADLLSLADIEKAVMDFGARARDNKLKLEELQGGTFSITNGGVFGSLMSTPILNSPQSGILGMHKIQPRPMAIDGKVEIRPMMYLALSYDHRLVDGREAVTFLVRVKENLEDPERMLLDV
jgi:2-oxoglutarate dehydrogenase E2 component (dihydrolipoamide succinyltransferase)